MTHIAFDHDRRIASGDPQTVQNEAKAWLAAHPTARILIFDDETGAQIDLDLRPEKQPLGRPKLGVVPREVTLLPRHWDWLNQQPGGASATLRKLVDAARHDPAQQRLAAQTATYKFLSATLGNAPHFEEACRALFSGDQPRFLSCTASWPPDLRAQALSMSTRVFTPTDQT